MVPSHGCKTRVRFASGLLVLAVLAVAASPRQPLLVREMGEEWYVSTQH